MKLLLATDLSPVDFNTEQSLSYWIEHFFQSEESNFEIRKTIAASLTGEEDMSGWDEAIESLSPEEMCEVWHATLEKRGVAEPGV